MRAVHSGALVGLVVASRLFCAVAGAQDGRPSLKVIRILTPAIAAKYNLGLLCPSLAVTPNGVAVVGDGDHLWAVGADGAIEVEGVHNAASFAISGDGLLVVVSGANLEYLDPSAKILKLVYTLPSGGMRIVAEGKDRFLLFGPDGVKGYALYELLPGRRAVKVIDSPHPITGVARSGDQLLVITGGALFSIDGSSMQVVAGEPGGALSSIAVDEDSGRVFLSDGSRTFEFKAAKLLPLFSDLGGELRWVGGGLLVFNPKQRVLAQIANLP
ncbi:MAG: hypothetical protein WBC92_11460 [Terracidiphilus sp.]